jgi:polysaccharide biosynthesis/export protein
MKRMTLVLAAVALVTCAGNSSGAPQSTKPDKQDPLVSAARNNSGAGEEAKSFSAAATADPAYVIGAQDVLDINIWKEPDVSRTVPVRSDGKISLPLINDVQAAGLTPLQLAQNVTDKLRKFLTDPQVTVIVTAINSQRVFVVGEVLRAGAFPLIPGMTVLEALSSAGGFTTFANVKKIHVMRVVNGKHIELPFNYREVIKGDNFKQNVELEAGDTVVVP